MLGLGRFVQAHVARRGYHGSRRLISLRRFLGKCLPALVSAVILLSASIGISPLRGKAEEHLASRPRPAHGEPGVSHIALTLRDALAAWLAPASTARAQAPSPGAIYVGTNGSGLIKRGSGGTWSAVNSGHDLTVVNAVLSPPGLPETLHIYGSSGTSTRKAYKSTDGGSSWTQTTDSPSSTNWIAARAGRDELYALVGGTHPTNSGLFKSVGGGSWTQIVAPYFVPFGFFANTTQPVESFTLSPGGRIWLVQIREDEDKLRYTDDDGGSFTSANDGFGFGGRSPFPTRNRERIYFTTGSGDIYRLDGTSGTFVDPGVVANGPIGSSSRDQALMLAAGTLYRTTNAGGSWSTVSGLTGGDAFVPDPQIPGNWWVPHIGSTSIHYSTDDGVTWSSESTGSSTTLSLAVAGFALGTELVPPGTDYNPYAGYSRDPVNTFTGAFTYSHTDLAVPGRGPTPAFSRSYSSADTTVGVLGPGWTHNYAARVIDPMDGTGTVALARPDGGRDRFTLTSGTYTPPLGVDTTLTKNSDHTWTAKFKDQSTWDFEPAGRLASTTDRYGNESALTYNSSGQLTQVSDPAGRGSLSFTYDGATGRLIKVSDWAGTPREVRFSYDGSGRLEKAFDREHPSPSTVGTTYAYDGTSARLISITDANGNVAVTNTYSTGRVATQKDAKGLVTGQQTTFTYNSNPDGTKTTVITYPATSFETSWSPKEEHTYDARSRLIKRVSMPTSSGSATPTNLALNKPASQSSTLAGGVASRAVDGNTSGNWADNSVSHTNSNAQAWWQVDLQSVQYIGRIDIWARTDCCSDRLADFDLSVSDDGVNWASYYFSHVYPSVAVPIGRTGRYVKIQLRGTNYLHLAEVQAWNALDQANWAVGRAASQSSTYPGGTAARAVDGNTSGNWNEGSVAHTENTAQPWWQVDLGEVRSIDWVDIWSRTDCCLERLADFDLKVSDDGLSWWSSYVGVAPERPISVTVGRSGRYVKVQLRGTNYLHIAEVQVWGKVLPTSPPTSGTEWATEQYRYDPAGNRNLVMDARGNTTNFCYDVSYAGVAIAGSRGNLTRRIDSGPAAGQNRPVTLYQYDSKNNLTQVVPPKGVTSGATVECTTDFSASSSSLYRTDLAYDAATQTKLESVVRRYTDPDLGQQTATTKLEYSDANNPGLVTRVIPPRGNTTSTPNYDYATSFAYYSSGSQDGMLERVTAPMTAWNGVGDQTTFAYDAVGRRTSMVDPLGNISGATASDHAWDYVYDREDRLAKVKTPAPVAPTSGDATRLITEFRYDAVGNRTHVIDANGQITQYLYDSRDALEYVKQSPSFWTPDGGGSIPSAPSDTVTTEYSYDNLGLLTRAVRAPGDSMYERGVDYLYDGLGRLRKELQYPSWPTLTNALVTDFSYDGNGNLTVLREPEFQPSGGVTYTYDNLNRLIGISYSDSTPDVAYSYDGHGNRILMDSGTPDTTYVYDEMDRLVSVAMSGGDTVGYRYDGDGNRRRLIYPGGSNAVDYTFEKDGKLASLTDWGSRTTSYSYFADGSVKDVTYPNATKVTHAYDNARRLTEIHHQATGPSPNTITRHAYTMDKVGNRTRLDEVLADPGTVLGGTLAAGSQVNSFAPAALQTTIVSWTRSNDSVAIPQFTATIKNSVNSTVATRSSTAGSSMVIWDGKDDTNHEIQPPGTYTATLTASGFSDQSVNITLTRQVTHSYIYDRLYRLASAGNAFGPTRYTYDPLGNRLTSASELTSTSYSYDKLDRLTAVGATSFSNDSNGSRTARDSDTFTYDQANRLTRAVIAGGSTTDYAYDGDGKRLCKSSSCTVPEFTYDVTPGLPLLLKDTQRQYVWGLGLLYSVSGSSIEVHHSDGLGSVRAATNGSAQVNSTYLTDDFGITKLVRGTSPVRMQYTGEPRDTETGFVDLRARVYDPSVGRFLQRDKIRGSVGIPQSLNRHAYVENSPPNRTDPSGRKSRLLAACSPPGNTYGSLFATQLQSAACTIRCTSIGVCTVDCQLTGHPSAARPTSVECPQDCEDACDDARLECEQSAWKRYGKVIGMGCYEGWIACLSTGGCFHNPSWRREPWGTDPGRPEWDEVWWRRPVSCDE